MRLILILSAFSAATDVKDKNVDNGAINKTPQTDASSPLAGSPQPTVYYGIPPPSFTLPENLTLFKRIAFVIGFGALISLTFIDISVSKKYRLPLLKATGFSVCIYELFMSGRLSIFAFPMVAIIFAVVFIFSFHEGMLPTINSVSSSYTSCMLFCTLIAIQHRFILLVSIGMYIIITLFILKHIMSLFDYLVSVSINTFLSCCILEITIFAIFTKGLTLPYSPFNFGFIISKLILLGLVALFAFVGPIIASLTGNPSKNTKAVEPGAPV
ncbi:hypothetical protein GINT2_000343 [Glugoides intestinalis]